MAGNDIPQIAGLANAVVADWPLPAAWASIPRIVWQSILPALLERFQEWRPSGHFVTDTFR